MQAAGKQASKAVKTGRSGQKLQRCARCVLSGQLLASCSNSGPQKGHEREALLVGWCGATDCEAEREACERGPVTLSARV